MSQITIVLAASARDWSDRLHRSVLDHGGATVVGRVMSGDQAIDAAFDVLFIDDVCSFLTPHLIYELRRSGKAIVGVFSPDDGSEGKRRLLEVGISDVAESEASPTEFLNVARTAVVGTPEVAQVEMSRPRSGMTIGVTGPPGGVGVTEIAIGLAQNLSQRHKVVLVDLNQTWPAVGQRLGLPVYPNLRTAADLALHEPDRIEEAMHSTGTMEVVAGLANPASGELPPSDIAGLVTSLGARRSHVVVDLGAVDRRSEVLYRRLEALLVVGIGDPVGITRVVRALEMVTESANGVEVGVVLNRVSGSPRQRLEIESQMAVLAPGVPVVLINEDGRLNSASWNGTTVSRGAFHRQVRRLASLFDGVPAS